MSKRKTNIDKVRRTLILHPNSTAAELAFAAEMNPVEVRRRLLMWPPRYRSDPARCQ